MCSIDGIPLVPTPSITSSVTGIVHTNLVGGTICRKDKSRSPLSALQLASVSYEDDTDGLRNMADIDESMCTMERHPESVNQLADKDGDRDQVIEESVAILDEYSFVDEGDSCSRTDTSDSVFTLSAVEDQFSTSSSYADESDCSNSTIPQYKLSDELSRSMIELSTKDTGSRPLSVARDVFSNVSSICHDSPGTLHKSKKKKERKKRQRSMEVLVSNKKKHREIDRDHSSHDLVRKIHENFSMSVPKNYDSEGLLQLIPKPENKDTIGMSSKILKGACDLIHGGRFIQRNKVAQLYGIDYFRTHGHCSASVSEWEQLEMSLKAEGKETLYVSATTEQVEWNGGFVLNYSDKATHRDELMEYARDLEDITQKVFPFFDIGVSKSRKLPSICFGYTDSNPNDYKDNRLFAFGTMKVPNLSSAFVKNVPRKIRRKIAILIAKILKRHDKDN